MKKPMKILLLCGMLGCLCYGGGDWLMIYGDPSYYGSLSWLTTLIGLPVCLLIGLVVQVISWIAA